MRLSRCSGCDSLLQVEVYPAYFRKSTPGQQGETILVEGEAACFYHAAKKAVVPCQGCGRFLCALCDCELAGEHFCPVCLETGRNKGKITKIESSRTRYDSMALLLATVPLLIFYFTLITAPAALFIALRRWNAPQSIVHHSRARLIVAVSLATIEILAWGIAISLLIVGMYGQA